MTDESNDAKNNAGMNPMCSTKCGGLVETQTASTPTACKTDTGTGRTPRAQHGKN